MNFLFGFKLQVLIFILKGPTDKFLWSYIGPKITEDILEVN